MPYRLSLGVRLGWSI